MGLKRVCCVGGCNKELAAVIIWSATLGAERLFGCRTTSKILAGNTSLNSPMMDDSSRGLQISFAGS
jgi:hypothetical protein